MQQISIAFRLDDPSPISDHALERRLFKIFERHEIPLTVAVVPFATNEKGERIAAGPQTLPHLSEALHKNRIEIALHGNTHSNRAPVGSRPSEYCGVPLNEQRVSMAVGKESLSTNFRVPVSGFVPPWNSFDEQTMIAAADNGFEYLSAGDWSPSINHVLCSIPRTCRVDRLLPAMIEARYYSGHSPVIVVVLHPDNFAEFRSPPMGPEEKSIADLTSFDVVLDSLARSGREIRFVTIRELAREYRQHRLWLRRDAGWLTRLPYRIRARLPRYLAFSGSRSAVLWHALRKGRAI